VRLGNVITASAKGYSPLALLSEMVCSIRRSPLLLTST